MTSLLQIVRDRLLGSERGQTLAEYSIIISVIAVGVVTLALAAFVPALAGAFDAARSCLDGTC